MVTHCTECNVVMNSEAISIPATDKHYAADATAVADENGKYYGHCTVCGGNFEQYVNTLWTRNDLFVGREGHTNIAEAYVTEGGDVRFVGRCKG